MARSLAFLAVLGAFWLLLSGLFTPFLLTAGAACTLGVFYLTRRMDLLDREGFPIHLAWRALFWYWPWLAREILKAGWDVTKRILDPRLPISPTLAEVQPSQRTDLGLTIHANSITLTPGTLCVEVSPGRFLVHALTQEGAAALANSEMDRRCAVLERA